MLELNDVLYNRKELIIVINCHEAYLDVHSHWLFVY